MGCDEPEDPERPRDRARGEGEGDEHRDRHPEDEQQHHERHGQREDLAAPEVDRDDRPEVALDRRLARDERP